MVYGLMRASAVREAGVFREVLCPDRLLLAELTLRGEIRQVPEVLWYRRQFAVGSIERQRSTLFQPGTQPPSRVDAAVVHARAVAVGDATGASRMRRCHCRPATARRMIAAYALSYAWRHYGKSERAARHPVGRSAGRAGSTSARSMARCSALYGVLVAARHLGITPLVEKVCERLTGRPRPWRPHA